MIMNSMLITVLHTPPCSPLVSEPLPISPISISIDDRSNDTLASLSPIGVVCYRFTGGGALGQARRLCPVVGG
ncbi:hypothetical protein K440DRAFT_164556 [Wilcoxina mikolae CBS 423.85]|nr:hypothetical protein K440DRAFT_164556 [Wilcoxina mikolae CBS 423.85]